MVLAVHRKQFADRDPGRLLDAAIELDEPRAEPPRQLLADGRLAGAAQAEQRDDARGVAHARVEQVCGLEVEGFGELGEPLDRDVGAPDSTCTRNRSDSPDRSASSRSVHCRSILSGPHALAHYFQHIRSVHRPDPLLPSSTRPLPRPSAPGPIPEIPRWGQTRSYAECSISHGDREKMGSIVP